MVHIKKFLKKKPLSDIPELPSLCWQMYQHLERCEEYPPDPSYLPNLHLSATRGAAERKRSAQNHLFKLRWRLNSKGCHVPFSEVINRYLPMPFMCQILCWMSAVGMETAVRYLQSAGDNLPSHGGQISWLIGCIKVQTLPPPTHTYTQLSVASADIVLSAYFITWSKHPFQV